MNYLMGALVCAALLVADFLIYQSSGASDCGDCSPGQILVSWGLIVLPLAIVGLLVAATLRTVRHR